ncbi:hypothetical protein MML48_6g00004783 [Holotrichia oblita]|uniref:Uncharacterized protein n=1 Tax=Holotrichia oblita TaxID=644536 RepID=A0ACB9T077_HOLOL|nr:hypothetical protein MML48_6g00004783 [Holotrichia oblita]
MCNETVNYPEDEIRQLVEKTPGYKELFGTILKTNRQVSVEDRNGDDEETDEEKETNMCGTITHYIAPKIAIDVDGIEHYVVNGDGMEQLVEYETCDKDASCVAAGHIPGHIVSCQIQEVIIRLTVYTKTSNGDWTSKMARGRQRQSTKGNFTKEQMEAAVRMVIEEQMSLRKCAERNGIKFQTLQRYVTKQKTAGIGTNIRLTPNYACRRIFTLEQEATVEEYAVTCAKMCFGKSRKDLRCIAYEVAIANQINVPGFWVLCRVTQI